MKEVIKRQISKYLRTIADRIDSGNTNLTEEEAMAILSTVAHERLSKEQSLLYLNMSRSNFDILIRRNKLPKGRKLVGCKELYWYKDELDEAVRAIKRNRNKTKKE